MVVPIVLIVIVRMIISPIRYVKEATHVGSKLQASFCNSTLEELFTVSIKACFVLSVAPRVAFMRLFDSFSMPFGP